MTRKKDGLPKWSGDRSIQCCQSLKKEKFAISLWLMNRFGRLEPVNASPLAVEEVHAMLREQMIRKNPDAIECVRILYGGSMKPGNAEELLHMPDIDGGLIAGRFESFRFSAIARQASKLG